MIKLFAILALVIAFSDPLSHAQQSVTTSGDITAFKAFEKTAKDNKAYLLKKYDLKPRKDSGQDILFGQRSVSPVFSDHGDFKGAGLDEIVKKLKNGELKPSDVPVQFIWVNGEKVAVNNRSLTVIIKAGLKPVGVDMSGQLSTTGTDTIENILQRLEEMDGHPSRSCNVRLQKKWDSKIKETVTLHQ